MRDRTFFILQFYLYFIIHLNKQTKHTRYELLPRAFSSTEIISYSEPRMTSHPKILHYLVRQGIRLKPNREASYALIFNHCCVLQLQCLYHAPYFHSSPTASQDQPPQILSHLTNNQLPNLLKALYSP